MPPAHNPALYSLAPTCPPPPSSSSTQSARRFPSSAAPRPRPHGKKKRRPDLTSRPTYIPYASSRPTRAPVSRRGQSTIPTNITSPMSNNIFPSIVPTSSSNMTISSSNTMSSVTPSSSTSTLPASLPAHIPTASPVRTHYVTTVKACRDAVDALLQCSRIAVDCEGVALSRTGRLCLLQLASPTDVFLVDLVNVNDPIDLSHARAMFAEGGLRELLETENVTKVLHDCRHDSDALFHQFDVTLGPVVDTQVVFSVLRRARGLPEGLPVSLRTLLKKFAGASEDDLAMKSDVKELMKGDGDFWLTRPLCAQALQYAVLDVQHLLAVTTLLARHIDAADSSMWSTVINESKHYVEVFRNDDQGPRKAQEEYEMRARVARRQRAMFDHSRRVEMHQQNDPMRSQSFKSQQRISRQRDGGIGSTYALNRILFDRHEQSSDGSVSLLPSDPRAIHVRNVLNLSSSNPLVRAAIVDELLLDQVPVSFSKYDDGSVTFLLQHAATTLSPPPIPPVTLVLAVPRPKVLARLIPQIAAMGVAHLVLVNAYKVERCYFDSSLLRNEKEMRALLLDGISQAGVDCRLPIVHIEKRLKIFLEDHLPNLVSPQARRLLAEPGSTHSLFTTLDQTASHNPPHAVLAIGPEGGWMPREVSMLEQTFAFQRISLGDRILRSDAAVLVLLGLVHEFLRLQATSATLQ